ncbi:MAG: hypothetical protein ABIC04_01780 [Nanoarchaeota archaeon]
MMILKKNNKIIRLVREAYSSRLDTIESKAKKGLEIELSRSTDINMVLLKYLYIIIDNNRYIMIQLNIPKSLINVIDSPKKRETNAKAYTSYAIPVYFSYAKSIFWSLFNL